MPASTTASLTDEQLAAIARQGGFADSEIPTAVAIAKAESGGNPRAHNNNANTGDNSYGLWQINMIGSMGPARRKSFGIVTNEALFDPVTNAKAAHQVYKEQGWNAWSVYKSGSYRKFLQGSIEVGDVPGLVAGPVTGGLISGLTNRSIDQLTEKFRLASVTYLVFLVALVLLILGVMLVNRQRVATVVSAVPAGKIANVVKGG